MKSKLFFLSILIVFSIGFGYSQNTAGSVTFSVTTVSNGGQFSPKNILAIWVKNSSGSFIRTLKLNAQQRIQYLYTWKLSSGLNTVNAVTGATLLSHQTHTVTWNCTNLSGVVVPDGNYEFWVEYADDDLQGPVAHYSFNKSISAVNQNFPNQNYFTNVSIAYTPQASDIDGNWLNSKSATIYQNISGSFVFQIPINEMNTANLKIFNIQGKLLYQTNKFTENNGELEFLWTPSINESVFVYQIEMGKFAYSGKVIKSME